MFISKIHLVNWRSYSDAEFDFERPSARRPLVLVGAMNGHGKTSLLFGLYVGLFGRFGLRHTENFRTWDGKDPPHYREAIRRFRRSSADADEPTSVEVVFSPSQNEQNVPEVRVVRRWFFTASGQPRQGDSFETVDLYIDGKPQRLHNGPDAAISRIERYLFSADVMPAFFFDGEQAQTLITSAGQDGMKHAVEVLFGTKIVNEAFDYVKQYVQSSHSKLGGKRNVDAQQVQLDEKIDERERLETEILATETKQLDLQRRREELEAEQRRCQETLAKLGGERKGDLVQAHADVERAEAETRSAEKALTDVVRRFGIALAVSRLGPAVANRLDAEASRERWENLRDGTIGRTEEVLDLALPEPPERDPLLGNLSAEVRLRVRDRFRVALEHIYNPPPTNCATEYLLGHVKGESRNRLISLLESARSQGSFDIRARAKRLAEARDQLEDAQWRLSRIGNLPAEVEKLSETLSEVGEQISETSRGLGAVENEMKKRRSELQEVNAEIGRIQEIVARLGPQQKRIAVAERARATLAALRDELRPITAARLQSAVTSHFLKIADRRYRGGEIIFPDNSSPILRRDGHPEAIIEMMSGFERRAFGISFSLALAEITRKRSPLVIDTPLGNADKDYRRRLLRAVMDVDLDQVIILTHDAEVAGSLFEEIEDQVKQTFLVEFDQERHESVVLPGAYFEGVGR